MGADAMRDQNEPGRRSSGGQAVINPDDIRISLMKRLLCSFSIGLLFLAACDMAYSFNETKIKDVLDHPREFEGKDITLSGTVTNAVSLVLIKYYEIEDGTGSIKVVTDKLLPTRGEKLQVTGRMTVVEVGTERWVLLRENQDYPGQKIGSEKGDYFADTPHNRTAY